MVLSRATTVHWSFMGTLPPPQPQGPHPYSWRKAHRPLEDSWQWDPSLSTGDDDLSILKEPCWTLLRTPRHWLCLGGGLHLDPAHPASLSPSTDIAYTSHSNWPGLLWGDLEALPLSGEGPPSWGSLRKGFPLKGRQPVPRGRGERKGDGGSPPGCGPHSQRLPGNSKSANFFLKHVILSTKNRNDFFLTIENSLSLIIWNLWKDDLAV